MALALYDSKSQQKKPFTPLDPKRITLYACGPTVYNYIHIGNARPAVVFDTLFRHLKSLYPNVVYGRNITDIDDKINAACREQKIDTQTFTQQYIQAYRDDLAQLNTLPPSIEPLCTDHVGAMIEMIQQLIDNHHAYAAEGHVLFDVASMPDYGQLSNKSQEDLINGARVEVAPYKKNASDFVLWKPSDDQTPGWESPWGYGRPGWHIECSAMIKTHLGEQIDIHGGGADLIFPHHENERAQSNCCHKTELAQVWMHNGYLQTSGEKMSKSLGNFVTLRELLAEYPGEVLRYALLSAHYRAPLEWSEDTLIQAKANLDRFYTVLRDSELGLDELTTTSENLEDLLIDFNAAMNDDLNTPKAFAALHVLAGQFFKHEGQAAKIYAQALFQAGQQLGLFNTQATAWFQAGANLNPDAIEAFIEKRQAAKLAKDYAKADEIRKHLLEKGIELEDTKDGVRWHLT